MAAETLRSTPDERQPRRWLRPRFSLAMLFVLTTLACVGTAIWYQWPYPVEHVEYAPAIDPFAAVQPAAGSRKVIRREVEWVRNVWSRDQKTIRHGPWVVYDGTGRKMEEGHYRHGAKDGKFLRYYKNGQRAFEGNYQSGAKHGAFLTFSNLGERTLEERFQQDQLHGVSREWDSAGQLRSERHYDRGLLHGRFMVSHGHGHKSIEGTYKVGKPDGKWTWFPSYASQRGAEPRYGQVTGQWQNGVASGTWEFRDPDGEVFITLGFENGRLVEAFPDALEPRLCALLAQGKLDDPQLLLKLFTARDYDFVETPLLYTALYMQENLDVPLSVRHLVGRTVPPPPPDPRPESYALRLNDQEVLLVPVHEGRLLEIELVVPEPEPASLPARRLIDEPVTYRSDKAPVIAALRSILEPHGLVCDYRYGMLWWTTPERAGEPDRTGVESLVPPPGSRLAAEWDDPCQMEFIETPLKDTLLYLQDQHEIRFDSSPLPPNARDLPVTVVISRVPFKHGLAIILDSLNLRASLRGETIVIEQREP